ncbi:LysR family transcriptional regulator, partial [Phaeovulum sp.]|uniref:helix-turn-helix domain-containing protein n=1 Tax=Phaeovulum sp. TaxID=2934796 RepID=UPI0034DE5226
MHLISSIKQTNMADIDLRLLRLFHAVYETGSTTKAAIRLGLSQPSVSIGLGQLRAHY